MNKIAVDPTNLYLAGCSPHQPRLKLYKINKNSSCSSLSVLTTIFQVNLGYQGSLKQRMMEVVVTTGAISRVRLQSNHHYQQTNIQFFYRPDALPVTQPTVSKH